MKLSVVIPCYNAAETLGVQLDALANQEWSQPWEIVLADNGSTDNSREIAASYRDRLPNLRVVDASQKQGSAYATNAGIRAARGESLALCDADDEVGPGWVAAMGDALEEHDFIACRMDMSKLNPRWLRGHEQEKGLQTIWYPPFLPHVGGGTMGFKRTMFDAVGGFDETLLSLQDTDFCFQAQMKGFSIHFVPEAVLHVRRRGDLKSHYVQSRNYAEYNVVLAKKYWSENASATDYYLRFIGEWFRLILSLRELRSPGGRFAWVWRYGRQSGRLKGMLRWGGVPV